MLAEKGCGLCTGGHWCTPGVCWTKNVMLCMQCRRWQPKCAWSPAQWKSLQCVMLDLQRNCCSECSSDYWCSIAPTTPTSSPTSSPTPSETGRAPDPGWAQSLLVVLGVDSTDMLRERTYRLAQKGICVRDFMTYWVDNLRQAYRKSLSHNGAVRVRQGMDGVAWGGIRCDWTDPLTRERYFDPGNDIYSRAFHLALPAIASNWNAETHGDIFEGLLALKIMDDYGTIRKYPNYPHFPPGHPAILIAEWIDELVIMVWGVCKIYPPNDSPAEWADRWFVQV